MTVTRKKIGKWMLGLSAVAAGAAAVSYVVTKKLVDVAVDRETPEALEKTKETFAGSEKMREIMAEQKAAAGALEALPHEDVELTAFDGEKLLGHWVRCENPARTLIAFHGWRSSWSMDFGLVVDFWQRAHCNVLFVEQRGQNGSSGAYMGFGLLERHDCLTWAEYVDGLGEGLPVYLVGVSMGASTVLMASGMQLPACVHGIMADCGYTSPNAIWKYISEKNLHLPYTGLRRMVVDDLCRRKWTTEDNNYSCTDALRHCIVPVLFIHGTADHFVPVEMSFENYLACAAPKELLIVPGADHGMSYLVERERYEATCNAFFEKYDK